MIRATVYDWVYERFARWYLIRGYDGSTAGGIVSDPDEVVECSALTKLGARHLVRWSRRRGIHLRIMAKAEWQAEHETGLYLCCPTCGSNIVEAVTSGEGPLTAVSWYSRRCVNGHVWDVRGRS